MSIPLLQRLLSTKLHSARYPDPTPFQLPDPQQLAPSLTPPSHGSRCYSWQASASQRSTSAHGSGCVVAEEYHILESVNYALVTHALADWVCLFEARFSLSVQHLRQCPPQVTGSQVSLLARVPSGVLASLAPVSRQ